MAAVAHLPELHARIVARIEARRAEPAAAPAPAPAPAAPPPSPAAAAPKPATKARLRKGHSWYSGHAGTYTDEQLGALAGRWVACPGCTVDDQAQGNCHLARLQQAFRAAFPERECFRMCSLATDAVEGKGGLRDVLVAKDAVFAGVLPKRGSPHARELGICLEESIFGNPEHPAAVRRRDTQKRKRDEADAAAAAKPPPRNRARHFIGGCHWSCTCTDWMIRKRELPEPEQRVCKHILGVQDDLDVAANEEAAAMNEPAPYPFEPNQLYADCKGYKPVYQFQYPGGLIKGENFFSWEVERSSAGKADDHDDYVVKKFFPVD